MKPCTGSMIFTITLNNNFKPEEILKIQKGHLVKVVKNYYTFNKNKSKQWKKILLKLEVKEKTGIEIKLLNT